MDKHQSNAGKHSQRAGVGGSRRIGRALCAGVLAFGAVATTAEAGTLSLAWNANPEPGVAGYILYYGTTPGSYTASVNVGNRTDYTFTEPQAGRAYFFALQAYNVAGQGGPLSIEISSTILTAANFDGDDRSDLATFRPSDGRWRVYRAATGSVLNIQWGLPTDVPVTGDYDGDGKSDVVVFRPSEGLWFILQSSDQYNTSTPVAIRWGANGDLPFLGDFDGDGRDDLTVYRRSSHTWYLRFANGATTSLRWGTTGDVPLVGDWDGDRKSDFCVYRPSDGRWYVTSSRYGHSPIGWWSRAWGGGSGDKPIIGDFDGDGATDLTIYRNTDSQWYVWLSAGNFRVGNAFLVRWGAPGDQPLSADIDGDRRTDVTVFRPSEGRWYVKFSSSGYATGHAYNWGQSGDVPIAR